MSGDEIPKKVRQRISGVFRQMWMRYDEQRRSALRGAKLARGLGWLCAECKKPSSKIDVDHVIAVGSIPRAWADMGSYCRRLFCHADSLRVLCKECHKAKPRKAKEAS